jgi:hypothetical protein
MVQPGPIPEIPSVRRFLDLPPLNKKQTAELAFAFCFIWFIANWSVNASLGYTSVASATILSSTSGRSFDYPTLIYLMSAGIRQDSLHWLLDAFFELKK